MSIISIVHNIIYFLTYLYRFHCTDISSSTSARSVLHITRYFLCLPKERATVFSSRNVFLTVPDTYKHIQKRPSDTPNASIHVEKDYLMLCLRKKIQHRHAANIMGPSRNGYLLARMHTFLIIYRARCDTKSRCPVPSRSKHFWFCV